MERMARVFNADVFNAAFLFNRLFNTIIRYVGICLIERGHYFFEKAQIFISIHLI